MALKVRLNKKKTFEYDDGTDSFSVTFDFPYQEDIDKKSIREILDKRFGKMEFKEDYKKDDKGQFLLDKKGKKIPCDPTPEEYEYLGIMSDVIMRKSLVSWDNVFDEDGNKVEVTLNEKGEVEENLQKAIYEVVKQKSEFYIKILMFYMGTDSKNLETGVTPQSTGAGQ